MARRRGGFGENPFGQGGGTSNNGPPSTRPSGPNNRPGNNPFDTGIDVAGGNNRNRQRNRNQRRNRNNGPNLGGGGDAGTTDPDDPEGDSANQDLAFQNEDYYRQGAMGKLTNAGVNFTPGMGGNQADWLNNQIDTWINNYQGQELTTQPDLTWEDYLNQQFGGTPAPPTYPTTGNDDIMHTPVYAMGKGKGKGKGKNKNKNGGGGKNKDDDPAAPTTSPDALPANTLNILTRNFEAATPTQRGYDSRVYRAPKRTIAF